MLNPNASEFKPGQFGTPSTPSAPTSSSQEEKLSSQQQQQHAKRRPPKSNKPQQQQQQKQQKNQGKSERRSSSDQHPTKKSNKSKNQQQQQHTNSSGGSGGRRHNKGSSSSTQKQQPPIPSSYSTAAAVDNESFGLLTKFITIEEAIDPVFRTRPTDDGNKNIDNSGSGINSGVGGTSGGEPVGKLVHGYERYIEWINRCLRAFETITIVGMDYAIADVVSLVTILQRRKIGEHEEVETFSLDQGNKRYTSGIQVKLHICT
ncbi:hypothetical protein BDA99DRAFT_556007 [Phascolomyces articulosus]|uniref:Uncharacterized protein n=1 Tax=Phascolomyces articulosus TaxID=60185 RepID=A0AAD5K8Q1_9FUNG|nr:hypothetical protein BDA99DRAFT_556007 [Phascolomyces articulosus]